MHLKGLTLVVIVIGTMLLSAAPVAAHCQTPCAIYDDKLRMQVVEEHLITIERSMMMIRDLGNESPVDFNQLIRWIDNKETHAQGIQDTVTSYFMTQRIVPAESTEGEAWDEYIHRLTLLHGIQIAAMKVKQTSEQSDVQHLRSLIEQFRGAYFGKEGSRH